MPEATTRLGRRLFFTHIDGDGFTSASRTGKGKINAEVIEEQIIKSMQQTIPDVLEYERRVRREMVKENRPKLHDKVSRALGILQSARTITSEGRCTCSAVYGWESILD